MRQPRRSPCSARCPFSAGLAPAPRPGPQRPAGSGPERPVSLFLDAARPALVPRPCPLRLPGVRVPRPGAGRCCAPGGAGGGRPFSGLAPGCSAPRRFPGTSRGARLAVRPRPVVSSAALSARPGLGKGSRTPPGPGRWGRGASSAVAAPGPRFPAGSRRGGRRLLASVGSWGWRAAGQEVGGAEPEKRPRPAGDLRHPRTSGRQPAAGIAP
nr:translation initiation factor IF-2-like [Pongo abelii]